MIKKFQKAQVERTGAVKVLRILIETAYRNGSRSMIAGSNDDKDNNCMSVKLFRLLKISL